MFTFVLGIFLITNGVATGTSVRYVASSNIRGFTDVAYEVHLYPPHSLAADGTIAMIGGIARVERTRRRVVIDCVSFLAIPRLYAFGFSIAPIPRPFVWFCLAGCVVGVHGRAPDNVMFALRSRSTVGGLSQESLFMCGYLLLTSALR
ncbi:hypothetical protein AURDEDRAFT_160242 [Auricularia subglabra TFB-10046 SS5]|nr:hypothetical protein AURDEDRAFT_160242 [Auricularia subglabra TFB-10046 SS5]